MAKVPKKNKVYYMRHQGSRRYRVAQDMTIDLHPRMAGAAEQGCASEGSKEDTTSTWSQKLEEGAVKLTSISDIIFTIINGVPYEKPGD